jgi:hypothetical protein
MQFRFRKFGSPLALIPELVVFIFIELKDALPSYIVIYCRCDLGSKFQPSLHPRWHIAKIGPDAGIEPATGMLPS